MSNGAHSMRLLPLVAALVLVQGQGQEPALEDPMRPFEAAAAAGVAGEPPRFELTGILVSPRRRLAVINGRFYREGERVNGDEILRIERGSIRLRRGSEIVRLVLREASAVTAAEDGDERQ